MRAPAISDLRHRPNRGFHLKRKSNMCFGWGVNQRPFPLDLVQTQTAWSTTYRALAAVGPGAGTTVLRRRLLRLSTRLWWHPYWTTAEAGPAARADLREHARGGSGREAGAA